MNIKRFGLRFASAVMLCAGIGGRLWASPLMFGLNDTTNGVSATATFNAAPGGFYIEITNTESNTANAGLAIGQFQFTVGNGFALPTAFTEIVGSATTFIGPTTAVDDTTATNAVDHWKYTPSNPNGNVFDVGSGGQPNHLIVAAGSTPNASLTNTHLPSFIGPVDFYFTDASGVPTSALQITDFKFAFGTTPEVPLESGTPSVVPNIVTPEPTSLALLGVGVVSMVGYGYGRRKQAAV